MDATKGSGSRVGTRSNPLGLERTQNAAINYGMNSASAYRPSPRSRPALPPAKKPSTSGNASVAKKPATGAVAKNTAATGAGVAKKPNVAAPKKPTGAPSKPVGAPSKAPATGAANSGKMRVSAASKPKAKSAAGAAGKK